MQKVYLLLRSNQQTGPFSLEELLQFDLKPYDLIWIEGRSAGWYYPQEIQTLQPYLSFLKEKPAASTPAPVQESIGKPSQPAGPKTIFVSMPSNASKEEPTPKPSFSAHSQNQPEAPAFQPSAPIRNEEPETLKTTYAKSLEEVETDYMNWTYQKKAKKKSPVSTKGLLVACLIVSIAFGAWKALQPPDENPGKTPPEQAAFLPVQNELTTDSAEEPGAIKPAAKSASGRKQKQSKPVEAERKQRSRSTKQQRQVTLAEEVVVRNESQPAETESMPIIGEEKRDEEKVPEPTNAEKPKEKKKLRDKIADLFRKKPEEKGAEAKPVEEESGERRSVRRDAGANLAQMVTIKFSVPNDWMLGIKGAKATITNRSGETIVKALVEVVYYNDDGEQLDKRTISFTNIKSKQTQTVSVPDHQTATRLEYNVISATGANEPFARR